MAWKTTPEQLRKVVAARIASVNRPERVEARRLETDRRLRDARNKFGSLRLRMQPYLYTGAYNRDTFKCLPGLNCQVTVDESIDVHDLMADTIRFWKAWRPARRRTDASKESVRSAWELLERAASDLKP